MKRTIRDISSLTPEPSLSTVSKPVSNDDDGGGNKKRSKQAVLNFKSDSCATKTCTMCGMTFYKFIKKDQELHQKYHATFLQGITWPKVTSREIMHQFTVKSAHKRGELVKVNIITIDKRSVADIRRTKQVLDMVNKELNAPAGSNGWSKYVGGSMQCKAFLAIHDNRVIGIVVTDVIHDVDKQARWMVFKNQTIVPHQVNKRVKVGISRIWVAFNWRRLGIASQLLNMVLVNTVHGIRLDKHDIAFSQPSTNGGLLCKKFNGVVHKSGETLLPVYLEDD